MEQSKLYDQIDEALLPFHTMIADLADFDGSIIDETACTSMSLQEVQLELPILLEIVTDVQGGLILGVSPPLYYVATGIESIYHKLVISIVSDLPPPTNSSI